MPRVGFKPTITASERAKTVHALDRSATVTGFYYISTCNSFSESFLFSSKSRLHTGFSDLIKQPSYYTRQSYCRPFHTNAQRHYPPYFHRKNLHSVCRYSELVTITYKHAKYYLILSEILVIEYFNV
jgi:hypothetical protein